MTGEDAQVQGNRIEVESHYVRGRHAMAVYADFGELYVDYYLHLMQVGVRLEAEQDVMLKDALAALTLHLMSRPRDEMTAWTLNFRDPPLNLFVTGDSQVGNVVGRAFTDDVKTREHSLFYAQTTRPRYPVRQSTVDVSGRDVLDVVEQYYRQSEQLPARLFRQGGDAYAMLVAQPDIDLPWFEAVDAAQMPRLKDDEELGFLERRGYFFGCGCSLGKILDVVTKAFGRDPVAIFQGEAELVVQCPRCAGTFAVTPDDLDAFLREQGG